MGKITIVSAHILSLGYLCFSLNRNSIQNCGYKHGKTTHIVKSFD